MKNQFTLFIISSLILISSACNNQLKEDQSVKENTSSIFLVRHAEKADDGTKDPPLTAAGEARAQRLSLMLKNKNITQVFSSDYKRTRFTASPTAEMANTTVQLYDPRDPKGFAEMLEKLSGQNILVVGHSNSTPTLANTIMDDEIFIKYEESEYSNIIEIRRTYNSKSALFSTMK